MSIVRLKKVTLCGLITEKGTTLEALQRLGCLHLVPLAPPPEAPEQAALETPRDAYKALRYLTDCTPKRRPMLADPAFDGKRVVEAALENQRATQMSRERRDELIALIQATEPWGDFELPKPEDLNGRRLWFYVVPLYRLREVNFAGLTYQEVHRDNRYAYVVVISAEEPSIASASVSRAKIGAMPLSRLEWELEQTEARLEELNWERVSLTRWIFLLTQDLARAEDAAAWRHAQTQTLDREHLFAIQGWTAVRNLIVLRRFTATRGLALLEEWPVSNERPPTLLENPPSLASGEELARFFQIPGYWDWDPSPVLFFSFALFFGMILSDAGYALLLAGLLGLYWPRVTATERGRRLGMLAAATIGAAIGYGLLVGSYFGSAPPPDTLLARLKRLEINDFDAMIRLSIIIGIAHLGLANSLKAWHHWPNFQALAPLGWNMLLMGGLLLWLASNSTTDASVLLASAGGLCIGGMLAVLAFSSTRPVQRKLDIIRRGLEGLYALTNISKAFGDVLSYMRLFALGLASVSLALTFNRLSQQVAEAFPGLGIFLGVLILIFGHVLNFALAIMSGVVHGLRLNFIEFYHWGLSQEGYPFRAFHKKALSHE